MMRYHHMRFDIWLCLALSFLISYIPANITKKIYNNKYDSYVESHTVSDGDIGGVAGTDIFRAESIEDVLSHDKFTVVSPGIKYSNEGGGYYKNYYMYALTLPSGERIAAIINMDSVVTTGETIYDGDSILPVGEVVYEDLSKETTFLNQIEHSKKLSRYDFYIDMLGNGGKLNKEDYTEVPVMLVQLASTIILFAIFHTLGSKIGIFPYFFAPKESKKNEWD